MMDRRGLDEPTGGEARGEEDLLGPEIRELLASLPGGIAPERDLMPEIAARTGAIPPDAAAETVVPGVSGAKRVRARRVAWTGVEWGWLSAAAVLLVVLSSALTVLVMRGGGRGSESRLAERVPASTGFGGAATLAGLAVGDEVRQAALEYEAAVSELRAVLERNRDVLSPGTMEIVDENLAVLDAALRETMEALEAAPGDSRLRETMVTAYERKLEFLREAVALTAES